MDSKELSQDLFNDLAENNEWDECFKAVEDWEEQQDLITKSNLVTDKEAPKQEHLEVLSRCFGHRSFRPMQWKIISSIINDKRDNCAIMATGYGKSLCFQYPAVYVGGITIVISPLISLMEDQILSLGMSNISACLLGSAQTNKKQTLEEIFSGQHSLIYITPEFACGDYGQDLLKRMNDALPIILLAIDEAHCVSSWGHDFRFQYRALGTLRNVLPHVPILAVTATATPKVRSDIVTSLKLRKPQILCSGFDRPNLQFTVHLKGNNGIWADLRKVMTEKNGVFGFSGSTIIYCITRKQTEEIAQLLSLNGVKCLPYHAGMTVAARKDTHEKFVRDKTQIIVATIAFGMGIDKPDVRYVIHCGSSKDIESYYQEVGRAGRDGQPSFCITFYNSSDFDLHQTIRELNGTNNQNRARRETMEKTMIKYLETRDCRRQFILNHFEGSATPKKPKPRCCDNCTRKLRETVSDTNKYEGLDEKGLYDFGKDAHVFLGAVRAMNGKFGLGMYILFVRGSKSSKLYSRLLSDPLYGSGKYQTEEWWKAVARLLEREGYLKKTFSKKGGPGRSNMFHTYQISSKAEQFLGGYSNGTKILLQPSPEIFKLLKRKQRPNSPEESQFINPKPSSSKKSKTSKPTLKLVQVSSQSTSKSETVQGNNSDTSEIETETNGSDLEKQERMTIYRLLMNKRTEIASTNDCMPYMVASNEALLKMAQVKPLSIKELRECQLEGFTEAKISRFGEEFIKTMRIICNVTASPSENVKKTIQDILAEHPLPGAKIGASAEATYSMYKSGLTAQEIATKRGVVPGTIFSHLSDAIKVGYPIKMIDLGITDELRETVLKVIKSLPAENLSVTPIKELCPAEVTFDVIRIILSFVQVRRHLASLKVNYEEYEDFEYEAEEMSQNKRKDVDSVTTSSPIGNQKKKLKLEGLSLSKQNSSERIYRAQKQQSAPTHIQKRTEKLIALLDSPPQSRDKKSETTRDLDETLLEDDFLDDDALNNVDKMIGQETHKSQEKTESPEITIKENQLINNLPSQSIFTSTTTCHQPQSLETEKNKFKKFQFKSKVPLSVEKSTHKLINNQQNTT